MSSETKRKKNKSKHAAWEAMTSEELCNMLGKRGRVKAIRAILRKRFEAMNLLLPDNEKVLLNSRTGALSLYGQPTLPASEQLRRSARIYFKE